MKISVFTAWLIVAIMVSGSREASGQATKEPPKAGAEARTAVEAQLFRFGGGPHPCEAAGIYHEEDAK